jgi:5-amino-6-(5-phosphoribosylamino)uracil reductase
MRPHVILSCAMSLDGYIDDATDERLILSGPADLDRVDALRASCDAILVGAGTVRADNPRLLVRSDRRRAERRRRGRSGNPIKVTLTTTGDLDPGAAFFTAGDAERIVYVPPRTTIDLPATVVPVDGLPALLADLAGRGVGRLLVEGGTAMHTAFLSGGLADELQLAVAPILVGGGTRFVDPATFPPGRLGLRGMRRVGDMAVLTYTSVVERPR